VKSAITPGIASVIERPIHRGVYRPLAGGRRKSISARFADILKGRTAIAYDPQDLTTLFQDAAGTLPVYRPGTGLVDPPVGLMLDKGQGLELGPELVVNGGFDTSDLSSFIAHADTSMSVVGGRLYLKADKDKKIYASIFFRNIEIGKRYLVSFDYETFGYLYYFRQPSSGSNVNIVIPKNTTGSFSGSVSITSPVEIYFRAIDPPASGNCDWFLDNISVREIKGYHAYQTTPPNRPPLSGRYNLLTATETLSTQSVTTVATNYTLKFEGAGTVTLSGTATGTYSAGTHTITCTAGTLTCTVAGGVTKADLRVKRDGSSLPAYQAVVDANNYDTAGFPLFLKRDKVDDVLTCVAPAITGSQGMGSTGGVVLGPVIIPAGEYTPLSESATTGIPEITRYVAIDGALTASERAVVERYLSVPSSGVFADEPVFSFGLTGVASFSFALRTKADTAPVLIDWGDGTQSTHAGTTDQTASHTYAVSGTYVVKVYGADESVLTKFSTGAGGMSGDLVMPAGMTYFLCSGSNTLSGTLSLPSGMTYFGCTGSTTLSGTLSLPAGMTYFLCTGFNTLSGYTPSEKANNQQRFHLAGLNTMSSTDVDNILIDYAAAGGTWVVSKEITIQGNAANRTSDSDAAYASLAAKLTTLSVD